MTAPQVLDYCYRNRVSIRTRAGQVLLSPRKKITAELAAAVTKWKPLLVIILTQRIHHGPADEHEVWVSPEIRADWHLRCQAEELRRAEQQESAA